jgi:hypothetical protein
MTQITEQFGVEEPVSQRGFKKRVHIARLLRLEKPEKIKKPTDDVPQIVKDKIPTIGPTEGVIIGNDELIGWYLLGVYMELPFLSWAEREVP